MLRHLAAFCFLITSMVCAHHFQQCQSMAEVAPIVDDLLDHYDIKDILIVFDIDSTLMRSQNPSLQLATINHYRQVLRTLLKDVPASQTYLVLNYSVADKGSQLVDEAAPAMIKAWQEKGLNIIACTGAQAGPIGPYKRFDQHRTTELKNLGIDFSGAFPHLSDTPLSTIRNTQGQSPVFFAGILSVNNEKGHSYKGVSLVEFMKMANIQPKVIIFIDDSKAYVDEMAKALTDADPTLRFIGIEFTAESLKKTTVSEEDFKKTWLTLIHSARKDFKAC